MKCKNTRCKHNTNEKCELSRITIEKNGKCSKYEHGFTYYFYRAIDEMEHSNMITFPSLTDDIRRSIYYISSCLPLIYTIDEHMGIIVFRDADTKKIIGQEEILEMIRTDRMDSEKLKELIADFNKNGPVNIIRKKTKDPKELGPNYGFLSPEGEFFPADFGEHEAWAQEKARQKYKKDFLEWKARTHKDLATYYMIEQQGYIVIHNPTTTYIQVVSAKSPTKKQKEFLYRYFKDRGMPGRAEEYLDDQGGHT